MLASIVFWQERKSDRSTELFYWLVIIIVRTGATNIADYLAFRVHIPQLLLSCGLALLIALAAVISARRGARHAIGLPRGTLPPTDAAYWVAMLGAGVFGTVVGDVASHFLGEGYASLALGALLALALAAGRGTASRWFVAYWAMVMIARTTGTAMGDWLAENKVVDIGLPVSTLMTGTAFVAMLMLWRGTKPQHDPARG